MSKKIQVVTGTFLDSQKARATYELFRSRGYSEDEINLLMSEETQTKVFSDGVYPPHATGPGRDRSQITETAAGTAVGSVAGLAAGLAISVALPGLGLVLLGPLAGAGTGALAGGAIAALHGMASARQEEQFVHEVLNKGGVILGVVPKADEQEQVRELLIKSGGTDIRIHHYDD